MLTIIIIIVTSIISITAFKRSEIFAKYQFNPYQVYHRKQYIRLVSHGFIHADWNHLIFNMISLYFFGGFVEQALGPAYFFIILYIGGIIIASLTTLKKHKDNYWYNSVGASGGVSAVVFASILLSPWSSIYFFFIPIPIPAVIFGIAYLAYSQYMSRRNVDNINHDAHFLGAIFGFTFPILIDPSYFYTFINQLFHP